MFGLLRQIFGAISRRMAAVETPLVTRDPRVALGLARFYT